MCDPYTIKTVSSIYSSYKGAEAVSRGDVEGVAKSYLTGAGAGSVAPGLKDTVRAGTTATDSASRARDRGQEEAAVEKQEQQRLDAQRESKRRIYTSGVNKRRRATKNKRMAAGGLRKRQVRGRRALRVS